MNSMYFRQIYTPSLDVNLISVATYLLAIILDMWTLAMSICIQENQFITQWDEEFEVPL